MAPSWNRSPHAARWRAISDTDDVILITTSRILEGFRFIKGSIHNSISIRWTLMVNNSRPVAWPSLGNFSSIRCPHDVLY